MKKKKSRKNEKREGRSNSVGSVVFGVDSEKWDKLNRDNEQQRKFGLLP